MVDAGEPGPVAVIGDSYCRFSLPLLSARLNVRVQAHWQPGGTEGATAYGREPELLDGVRVVVWVLAMPDVTAFKPLPPATQER